MFIFESFPEKTREEIENKVVIYRIKLDSLEDLQLGGELTSEKILNQRTKIATSILRFVTKLKSKKPIKDLASKNEQNELTSNKSQKDPKIDPKASLRKIDSKNEEFSKENTSTLKICILPFFSKEGEPEEEFRNVLYTRLKAKQTHEKLDIEIKKENNFLPESFYQAYTLGQLLNSDLIIWGSYQNMSEKDSSTKVSIHYVLTEYWQIDKSKRQGSTADKILITPAELREGYLQNNIDYIIYWILGMAAFEKNELRSSSNWFERALSLDNEEDYSYTTYSLLGVIFNKLGAYRKSLSYSEKGFQIYTNSTLEPEGAILREFYNNIGISYHLLGQDDQAFEFFDKNLKEKTQDEVNQAILLSNAALVVNDHLKDSKKALGYLEKALEKISPPSNITIDEKKLNLLQATIYNNVASVFHNYFGDDLSRNFCLKQALENLDAALRIYQKYLENESHLDFAGIHNNIALMQQELENFQEAVKHHLKSIEIQEKFLPLDHPHLLNSYLNTASTYSRFGQHDKAKEYYEKYIKISEGTSKITDETLFSVYERFIDTLNNLEEFEEAKKYTKIVEEKAEKDSNDLNSMQRNFRVLFHQATHQLNAGKYDDAISSFLKANSQARELFQKETGEWQNLVNGISNSYHRKVEELDNIESKISVLHEGIKTLKELLEGESHLAVNNFTLSLSALYQEMASKADDYEEISEFYATAENLLVSLEANNGDKELFTLHKNIGIIYQNLIYKKDDPENAIEIYSLAEKALEKLTRTEEENHELKTLYKNKGTYFQNSLVATQDPELITTFFKISEEAFKNYSDDPQSPELSQLYRNTGIKYLNSIKEDESLDQKKEKFQLAESVFLKTDLAYEDLALLYRNKGILLLNAFNSTNQEGSESEGMKAEASKYLKKSVTIYDSLNSQKSIEVREIISKL